MRQSKFREEMMAFHERVLAELKILTEGLGLRSIPNRAPLQENNILEVVNCGMDEKFRVRSSVIETLMPFNSDVPTVTRKVADLVFLDGERCYGNVSSRKGKEMLDPLKSQCNKESGAAVMPQRQS